MGIYAIMIIHYMEFILTNLREYYFHSSLEPAIQAKLFPFMICYKKHDSIPDYKELKQEYDYEAGKSHCSLTSLKEDVESM